MFENRLTKALCIYLGYGRYPVPTKHPEDLRAALGLDRAQALAPQLDEIVSYAVDLTVGAEIDLGHLAENAAKAVRRKYPRVGGRGRRALAWYVTHHWQ